jgi:hypothetical protein
VTGRRPRDDHDPIVQRDSTREPQDLPGTPGGAEARQRADHDSISGGHHRLLAEVRCEIAMEWGRPR